MKKALFILPAVLLGACTTTSNSPFGDNNVSMQQASKDNVALSIAYLRQGNRDLAMTKAQKAIDEDDDNADAYMARALVYATIGDIDKADDDYRTAIRKAPNDPEIQNNYAVFLCQNGKPDQSEKYFIEAATNPLYPTPEAAYTNAGVCANRVPDPASAEQYFRKALEINPGLPDALFQMAQLSVNQKRYLQARAFLQRLNSVSPQPRPEVLWLGVQTERALGNRTAAGDYARKLRQLFPDSQQTQQLDQLDGSGGR